MRDVYACRLPLEGEGPLSFDRAVCLVLAHLRGEPPSRDEWAGGSCSLDSGTTLRWRLLGAPELADRLWTLWADYPYEEEPTLSWALTVRIGLEAGCTTVFVHLGLRSLGYQLTPFRFQAGPPALVEVLTRELDVVEDHWMLSAQPLRFSDREGVADLVELLEDPTRVLPVVVTTTGSGGVGPAVDAAELAPMLLGLAHVVALDTTATTFALTDSLGKYLSVFGGAARVYWPGFDRFAEPGEHRLYLPARLEDPRRLPLGEELVRRLGPLAAVRLTTAALEARIRGALERTRRADVARWRARAESATLDEEWQQELERSWAEADQLRRDNADLAAQLSVAQENVRVLASYQTGAGGDLDADIDAAVDAPTSIFEAAERAGEQCGHLVMLEEARTSAARATYRQPARVWQALVAMDEIAEAWEGDKLGGGFYEAFAERGLAFRSQVSPTSLGKWAHEYERTYDGRRIALGPHLSLGKGSPEACCRIYFYLDEERHRFVVGHVGNHLQDSTTG